MAGIDEYTKLLIQSDGPIGSTTFTDLSASGHPVTLTGSGPQHSGDVECPIGLTSVIKTTYYGSLIVDKDTDPDSDEFIYGTQEFAVEFYVLPTSLTETTRPLAGAISFYFDSTRLYAGYYYSGQDNYATVSGGSTKPATSLLTVDEWNHIAIVRDATSFRLYVNGVLAGYDSYAGTRNIFMPMSVGIGEIAPSSGTYMQQVRISVGTNRGYTGSTITVPTAPFSDDTAITGSGSIDIPMLTINGSGGGAVAEDANYGSIDIPLLSCSGTGNTGGSGRISIPVLEVKTWGGNRGTIKIPSLSVSGSGSIMVSGSGSITIPALEATTFAGSTGSIEVPPLDISGYGSIAVTGYGAIDIPQLKVSGSGYLESLGSGAIDIPPLSMTGFGHLEGFGSGLIDIPAMRCEGTGSIQEVTQGKVDIPCLRVRGFGEILQNANNSGAVDIPCLSVYGRGTIVPSSYVLQYERR